MRQLRFLPALLGVLVAASAAKAQDSTTGPCATPDSVAFRGQSRVPEGDLRADVGIAPKSRVNSRILDRAIRDLYATNNFEDNISVVCEVAEGKAILVFNVKERPVLNDVRVTGAERVSASSVRDRVDLLVGKPINPAQVAKDVARIDSLYQSEGYYLARVKVDTVRGTNVGGGSDGATLIFHVEEGHRLAISGVEIEGNRALSDKTIVGAISTKPEGFFWWRNGEFDSDKYAEDLAKNIPALYASHGYIDMQVVRDTLIIDRERGKALVRLTVNEGPKYHIGSFEVNGARRFSNDDIARFYPFGEKQKGVGDAVKGLIGLGGSDEAGTFNESAWDAATDKVRDAYENEGYIYATIQPVVERRRVGKDSLPTVDLRWEIDERSPAIVNRVDITGNDVTTESCIRRQLFVIPGDVFNKQRLIDSYRNIANLGFFEQDMPPPDYHQANDKGDIDIIFRVKEKRTGNVNFGASVGQGYGVGGFIGFDQPNLFGECKRGSLNWQFGKYIKDFSLSYTDPFIKQSNVSGTVSAYHQQSRFIIQNIGQSTTTGGQIQIGLPLPNSPQTTRFYTSYGGERVKYGGDGLVSTINCNGCFRSTLGFTLDHDTRLGLPFPVSGVHEDIQLQLNGGPLGGTAKYSRLVAEMAGFTPLGTFGKGIGPEPLTLLFGLSAKAGGVFGDPGPFFVSQAFSMGGVQYGEPLRGYEEFSITPRGYLPNADQFTAQRSSFGNAFFRATAQLGLRVSQQVYLDAFYDAGNLWDRPRDFDPTRLFRGAGFGGSLVTPLGPLGIDLGYGFDRVDVNGRPDPKWQVHFKFGQIF